jgi:hypothetical protein
MIARSFGSDKRELAVLPGAIIFFSFNFETVTGSKSANASLQKEYCQKIEYSKNTKKQGRGHDFKGPSYLIANSRR